jgi:CheY-like chemotaxis protein
MMASPGEHLAERLRNIRGTVIVTKPVRRAELRSALIQALSGGSLRALERHVSHSKPAEVRRVQILVAEDNPINQHLVRTLLERRGHTVVCASTGRQALTILEQQEFDVILMDVQMPEMDGFEVTAAIRRMEQGSSIRRTIIAVTANAMKGDQERCLAAGMDGYLSKPISAAELFDKVEGRTRRA